MTLIHDCSGEKGRMRLVKRSPGHQVRATGREINRVAHEAEMIKCLSYKELSPGNSVWWGHRLWAHEFALEESIEFETGFSSEKGCGMTMSSRPRLVPGCVRERSEPVSAATTRRRHCVSGSEWIWSPGERRKRWKVLGRLGGGVARAGAAGMPVSADGEHSSHRACA